MKPTQKRVLWAFLLLFSVVTAGASLQNSDIFFQIKQNFTVFSEVYQEVTLRYVDEVDPQTLLRTGIDAMLESLDPYTVLIDQAEQQSLEILTRGSYAGVGIEIGARGDQIVIIAPIEGYSAERQGIRAGDIILEVDGLSVQGLTVDDMQALIAGEPGSVVTLTIRRIGFDEPLDFVLAREKVEIKNVMYASFADPDSTIGYVALSRFGQNASVEVREAITRLQQEGSMQGLILDLRNNPGGLIDEAVKLVDLFVGPELEVVRTQGRGLESTFTSSTESPAFYQGPLVVLQNNGSASSSEIAAGALQDYDRAVLMGERSFGKGLVQVVRSLSYNTTLKITTSRYYIPSGRSIQSPSYSPENPDESMQLPDSLRNAFQTLGGRTVYDGVGVEPDVLVPIPRASLLEIALIQNNVYFDFANEYRAANEEFDYAELPDSVFQAFAAYLVDVGFTYESRAQRHLNGLRESLGADEPELDRAMNVLQDELTDRKMADLQAYREPIAQALFAELSSRYYTDEQRFLDGLRRDDLVSQAGRLLANPGEVARVLETP